MVNCQRKAGNVQIILPCFYLKGDLPDFTMKQGASQFEIVCCCPNSSRTFLIHF